MDSRARVWGYTGGAGMIQGFAAGYFLWDLCVSVLHVNIFGWGLLAHAVSALAVFSLGFVCLASLSGLSATWIANVNQTEAVCQLLRSNVHSI